MLVLLAVLPIPRPSCPWQSSLFFLTTSSHSFSCCHLLVLRQWATYDIYFIAKETEVHGGGDVQRKGMGTWIGKSQSPWLFSYTPWLSPKYNCYTGSIFCGITWSVSFWATHLLNCSQYKATTLKNRHKLFGKYKLISNFGYFFSSAVAKTFVIPKAKHTGFFRVWYKPCTSHLLGAFCALCSVLWYLIYSQLIWTLFLCNLKPVLEDFYFCFPLLRITRKVPTIFLLSLVIEPHKTHATQNKEPIFYPPLIQG